MKRIQRDGCSAASLKADRPWSTSTANNYTHTTTTSYNADRTCVDCRLLTHQSVKVNAGGKIFIPSVIGDVSVSRKKLISFSEKKNGISCDTIVIRMITPVYVRVTAVCPTVCDSRWQDLHTELNVRQLRTFEHVVIFAL
jgi:hypothetical protein